MTLSYTGIGFVDGDTCPITLDDREHDGAAAGQLLRFLGGDRTISAVDDATGEKVVVNQVIRQDRETGTKHDPAVGMTGGSYGGQIQFAAAAVEHAAGTDRLDAIIPLITWNDLAYSLAPENSALPGGSADSGSVSSSQTGVFKGEGAMLNFIGTLPAPGNILRVSGVHFHSYGKEPRRNRKLGHCTINAPSPAARDRALKQLLRLKVD